MVKMAIQVQNTRLETKFFQQRYGVFAFFLEFFPLLSTLTSHSPAKIKKITFEVENKKE
jgi:hypothetical protein